MIRHIKNGGKMQAFNVMGNVQNYLRNMGTYLSSFIPSSSSSNVESTVQNAFKSEKKDPSSKDKRLKAKPIKKDVQVQKCSKAALQTLSIQDATGYELDLSGYQFLNNGRFGEIVGAIKNLRSVNLRLSDINNEELTKAIPILKTASPGLESIDLGGVYYSKETLKLLLDSFPGLKSINLEWIQKSLINEREVAEIVTPWLRNNPKIESFESSYNGYSQQEILDFIDAFPPTLKKFGIGFWGKEATSEQFILAMKNLSQKCGSHLQELTVDGANEEGEQKTEGVIDNISFALLPDLFPNLNILNVDCAAVTSSSVMRDTYLKWKNLKNFDASYASLTYEDLEAILKQYLNLETLDLGVSFKNSQDLVKLAPTIIQNNHSTLKNLSIFYTFDKKGIDEGLKSIQSLLPQLESFEFDQQQLTDDNLKFIVNNLGSKITRLNLWKHTVDNLSNAGLIDAVLTLAKKCPCLQDLSLVGGILRSAIEPSGVDTIPSVFTTLETLDLSGLTEGFDRDIILTFIKHNPLLQEIKVGQWLSANDIEDLKNLEPKIGKSVKIIRD